MLAGPKLCIKTKAFKNRVFSNKSKKVNASSNFLHMYCLFKKFTLNLANFTDVSAWIENHNKFLVNFFLNFKSSRTDGPFFEKSSFISNSANFRDGQVDHSV